MSNTCVVNGGFQGNPFLKVHPTASWEDAPASPALRKKWCRDNNKLSGKGKKKSLETELEENKASEVNGRTNGHKETPLKMNGKKKTQKQTKKMAGPTSLFKTPQKDAKPQAKPKVKASQAKIQETFNTPEETFNTRDHKAIWTALEAGEQKRKQEMQSLKKALPSKIKTVATDALLELEENKASEVIAASGGVLQTFERAGVKSLWKALEAGDDKRGKVIKALRAEVDKKIERLADDVLYCLQGKNQGQSFEKHGVKALWKALEQGDNKREKVIKALRNEVEKKIEIVAMDVLYAFERKDTGQSFEKHGVQALWAALEGESTKQAKLIKALHCEIKKNVKAIKASDDKNQGLESTVKELKVELLSSRDVIKALSLSSNMPQDLVMDFPMNLSKVMHGKCATEEGQWLLTDFTYSEKIFHFDVGGVDNGVRIRLGFAKAKKASRFNDYLSIFTNVYPMSGGANNVTGMKGKLTITVLTESKKPKARAPSNPAWKVVKCLDETWTFDKRWQGEYGAVPMSKVKGLGLINWSKAKLRVKLEQLSLQYN